jgi:cytochrome P450
VSETESHTLPSGAVLHPHDTIICWTDEVMRDKKVFPKPLEFNPLRWTDSSPAELEEMNKLMLPFGYGARVCPGQHLAIMEGELVLAAIVRAFDLQLACPPAQVRRIVSFTVRADHVPMIFKKREYTKNETPFSS